MLSKYISNFVVSFSWHGSPYQPYMNVSIRITMHLYESIRKFIVFVIEPTYQNYSVVCCNPVFRCDRSRTDHCTVLHVSVGLIQARPNYAGWLL